MKSTFPGHHKLTDAETEELWNSATFVFDASTLLNLYRYPKSVQADMIQFMSSVKDRLWLPYHAALEFNRSRLKVVAGQKKKFDDIRTAARGWQSTVQSEMNKLQLNQNYSVVATKAFSDAVQAAVESFNSQVSSVENDYFDVHGEDYIQRELFAIFEGRIGPKPDQKIIDDVSASYEYRMKYNIPPGNRDESKTELFSYAGIH